MDAEAVQMDAEAVQMDAEAVQMDAEAVQMDAEAVQMDAEAVKMDAEAEMERRSSVAEGRLEVLQVYKLLQFLCERKEEKLEHLVQLGVPGLINLTEPSEGNGALHVAALRDDMGMAKCLLQLGASPNVMDRRGRAPVFLAAELGHDTMMDLLASNEADMTLVDLEGKGVLFYCIFPSKRHARCLQVALECKADVNNISKSGKPLLVEACERAQDCEHICVTFLERGADPNSTDRATGRTALMEAVRFGSVQLVRSILQGGGNANAVDQRKFNAVHFAAERGKLEILLALSGYTEDYDVLTADGNTALHLAAAGGHADCCKFLAQRGCNPKQKNLEGLIPRQIAKANKNRAALKELKKAEKRFVKFSKPEEENPNELWALKLHDWSCVQEETLRKAFMSGEDEGPFVPKETFVSVLLEHKAPLDEVQLQKIIFNHEIQPEYTININDFFKGLKYLQKAFVQSSYAPKQKKQKKGRKGKGKKKKGKFVAPLPICVLPPEKMERRKDGGPPEFMIENYRPYTDVTRFGRDRPPVHPLHDDSAWYVDEPERIYTSINYCIKTEELESLCLAFLHGVHVNVINPFYKTPLMAACSSGSYQMVQFLIELGGDVNARDQFNWTPLHHAAHGGQTDIIELLVKHNAEVNTPALNGTTPLMRAIQSCRLDCVELLLRSGANVRAQNKKEQNCLDIALRYGDEQIFSLVKANLDQTSRGVPRETTEIPIASNQETPAPAKEQAIVPNWSEKRMSLKENIITINPVDISKSADPTSDISYTPRTVWGERLSSSAHNMERPVERRNRLAREEETVELEDL